MSLNEIKNRTELILFKEYLKIMYEKIRNCKSLNTWHHGLGELILNQSKTTLIIKEVLDDHQRQIDDHMDTYREHLNTYTIRSLIPDWVEEKMRTERVIKK